MTSANTARTKPTTGDTKTSFVDTDHLGWLKCDGRSLDTTAYNLLFQVIGYTFGGSGANFNLPDAQGRVIGNKGTIVDACDPSGVAFPAGTVLGEVNHKLTIAEMPAHNHDNATGSPGANTTVAGTTSSENAHSHNYQDAYFAEAGGPSTGPLVAGHAGAAIDVDNHFYYRKTNGGYTQDPNDATTQIATSTVAAHTHTIASNGGDACHNNMQPTLFYGNMFVYSGVPINAMTVFPMKVGLAPMLL